MSMILFMVKFNFFFITSNWPKLLSGHYPSKLDEFFLHSLALLEAYTQCPSISIIRKKTMRFYGKSW